MALTKFQGEILRLIAAQRKLSGESYVAGGIALNEAVSGHRRSRDIDLFHDTETALTQSWDADRLTLTQAGFEVRAVRERPTFVEAIVTKGCERVVLEWSVDSAFRFFPLVEHPHFGLTLHPVDLATNKVLALVGRREPRDLVDVVESDGSIQPLGYLAWAAAGKDPGFSPASILEHAARTARYNQVELDALDFDGPPPDAATLSKSWHEAHERAREVLKRLPSQQAGMCVLEASGALCRLSVDALAEAVQAGTLMFHGGLIGGAWPTLK